MNNGFMKRITTLLFLIATIAAPVLAQQSRSTALSEKPTTIAKPLTVADQSSLVTEFDVNGLKVLVKRREGSLTVVAGLFIKGGARNVTAANAGIENLMLDAASEASANYPRERLRAELARTGTAISNGINLDYSVLSLASTRVNFDRSWDVFTDVALHPSFTPEDVERVRNRIVVSLSDDQDTPDAYLQQLTSRVSYVGHPYLNDPHGTPESVGKLTADDVRRYHKEMMQTSRLLLIVVGDVDPETIRDRVASTFGKLPRGDYKPAPVTPLSFPASTLDITTRDLPTNYIQGVFTAPPPDSPDAYPMRIATSILQSRLFVEIRVKRNLSYAPDAFLWSQAANLGGVYVTSTDANQSARIMLNEIEKLQREPISQDDLIGAIQQFLTRYYLGEETNAAQAGELAQAEIIGGGWRNAMTFMDKIRAVTQADVQRVAQKYMRHLRFVVLGDPKSVDKSVFLGADKG